MIAEGWTPAMPHATVRSTEAISTIRKNARYAISKSHWFPDTLGRNFAMLDLRIIVQNRFNYDEPVTVGYDIYSPQGKLLDFNITDVTLAGRSVDTLRFQPFIYHAYENKWQPAAGKNPPLYRVMLFTKRDGTYKEYMPLRIGFGGVEFAGGKFLRFGKELQLKKFATTPYQRMRRRPAHNCSPSTSKAMTRSVRIIRNRTGSTDCATNWGSTSSTVRTSTHPNDAKTAASVERPRTTRNWSMSI